MVALGFLLHGIFNTLFCIVIGTGITLQLYWHWDTLYTTVPVVKRWFWAFGLIGTALLLISGLDSSGGSGLYGGGVRSAFVSNVTGAASGLALNNTLCIWIWQTGMFLHRQLRTEPSLVTRLPLAFSLLLYPMAALMIVADAYISYPATFRIGASAVFIMFCEVGASIRVYSQLRRVLTEFIVEQRAVLAMERARRMQPAIVASANTNGGNTASNARKNPTAPASPPTVEPISSLPIVHPNRMMVAPASTGGDGSAVAIELQPPTVTAPLLPSPSSPQPPSHNDAALTVLSTNTASDNGASPALPGSLPPIHVIDVKPIARAIRTLGLFVAGVTAGALAFFTYGTVESLTIGARNSEDRTIWFVDPPSQYGIGMFFRTLPFWLGLATLFWQSWMGPKRVISPGQQYTSAADGRLTTSVVAASVKPGFSCS